MARGLSKVSPKTLDQGYNLGKLAWGKVLSHPWWPGQIYNEDLASLSTWITKKKGCVLVAFFGDNTYRWLDPEHVVSFEHQLHEKLKQSQDELFLKAVEDAMFEVKKRSALGLTCKCRNPSNFRSSEVQGYFEVDVAGYAAGSLYTAEQIEKNVTWIENMARVLAYRKAVFEEYDEPYFQAYGVQPMYNEHRADVSYSKKNAHHGRSIQHPLRQQNALSTTVTIPTQLESHSKHLIPTSLRPTQCRWIRIMKEDKNTLETPRISPRRLFELHFLPMYQM
ncbi:hypothetical protein CDL12_19271 [Handroanthus impetiginosus]|uniref:PWWP domain-containing protein n=1 Tax=Handroanthus impetiginosus TaxID=429701 RepID=A0A2G9GSH0_9LAMI|nr:hypothetical protein CDL12_19271 [Handroanthus impetiginosus]